KLVVPDDFPGVGIERQHSIGIERVTVGASRGPRPGLGLRGRPVDQVERGIVAAGDPRVRARAVQQRDIAPAVASRLTRSRNRRRSPGLLAGPAVLRGVRAPLAY